MSERIAKFIARSGVCSRREAEELIKQQRVSVNGVVVETPAFNVEGTENIKIDGEKLPETEKTRVWIYHKPAGLVTSHKDEKGRQTVFDNLPAGMPRVISVGRLDLNGWSRRYKVKVHGKVDKAKLEELETGCEIDGVVYGAIKVVVDSEQGTNAWLTVTLQEGKNREIRKVMKSLGLEVARLIRVSYGPFRKKY